MKRRQIYFILFASSPDRLFLNLQPKTLFLFPELWCELGPEILRLENLADLHLGLIEGGAFEPVDRLFLRLHFPQPETGDQLCCSREGPVDDGPFVSLKPDANSLGARMESLARQHDARFHEVLVEL